MEPSKLALKLKRFKFDAAFIKNQLLPGTIADVIETMYGAPQTYYSDKGVYSEILQAHLLLDRVANMEAICVAFIAEYSLSFSISKSLIKLVRVAQR